VTEQRDIVERLMNYTTCTDSDVDEAAAEITRLREQLRIAREGLGKASEWFYTPDSYIAIARDTFARMDQEARDDH
jgi:hypothetical protein